LHDTRNAYIRVVVRVDDESVPDVVVPVPAVLEKDDVVDKVVVDGPVYGGVDVVGPPVGVVPVALLLDVGVVVVVVVVVGVVVLVGVPPFVVPLGVVPLPVPVVVVPVAAVVDVPLPPPPLVVIVVVVVVDCVDCVVAVPSGHGLVLQVCSSSNGPQGVPPNNASTLTNRFLV
jgi:hypothetical protein